VSPFKCGDYLLFLPNSRVLQGAKRIVVQAPDGLKHAAPCAASIIEEAAPGARVYIHGDSSFGACDLQYPQLRATLDPDVIVHLGHTPYPRELAHQRLEPGERPRVVYVRVLSTRRPPRTAVAEAAEMLASRGARRVVLLSTGQHTHLLPQLALALSRRGIRVRVPPAAPPYFEAGQVIGCDYRLATPADAYAIVSGGLFHAIGLYLARRKPVVKIDPYRGEAVDVTGEGEKTLRVRLYKVAKAMDARRWGLIVGLKTGQYRPWLVDRLAEALEEAGREYRLLAYETLTVDTLRNVDSPWFDAYVVTSCPRLPIDDFAGYEKPVLTPGEAMMALRGELEPYRFPW